MHRLTIAVAALALAGLSAAGPAPAAGPELESRFAPIAGCHEAAHGENGEDWLTYRCPGMGGQPLWQMYNEGVRMRLGFGVRENYSGTYAAVRKDAWPVEYRGDKGRRFTPFAAIVRVSDPGGTTKSRLVVYRLRPDGASCIVGAAEGAHANAEARAIADASRKAFSCQEEPYLP